MMPAEWIEVNRRFEWDGETKRRRDEETERERLSLSISLRPSGSYVFFYSGSETELEGDLNLARRGGAADRAESAGTSVGIGRAKVSLVEEVEEFGAELQTSRFCNR